MKLMIRQSPECGLSIYVPKKDLEEPIVEQEHETLWGGWIKIANGWVIDLPALPEGAKGNAWASAQHIESNKHRNTVSALMTEAFTPSVEPTPVHKYLASL